MIWIKFDQCASIITIILFPFNSTNHTLKDVTITILEIPKSAKQELLDKLERQWITKLNTFHSGLNSDAGNPGKDSCTFILQHHPSAAKLTNIARDWLDKFNENNPKLKNHPISLITANARNKNLSQKLKYQFQTNSDKYTMFSSNIVKAVSRKNIAIVQTWYTP